VSRPAPGQTGSRWLGDIGLGVRLAVGSGRTVKSSLVRLTLVTIGIGLSTAVMLLLATVTTALSHSSDRVAARKPVYSTAGQAPLLEAERLMPYGDSAGINVIYLEPLTQAAPVPPGLRSIPAPGEMVVSPAFAKILSSDGNLRARFDQRIVGTVGSDGLQSPDELWAYAGATGLKEHGESVSGFGGERSLGPRQGPMLFLGVLGVLVVLIPLLVFVASSSRIAGAERERRLSALRLAGASSRQVHRIAAAETLVGAAAGELLGLVLFAVVRPFAAGVDIAGITVFPDDFLPSWPLVVVVLLMVPLIATGSAWLGMRKLVVEPLGVVRMGTTARRRGWWRLLLVAAGVALLLPDKLFGVDGGPDEKLPFLIAGGAMLMIGLPTLMPWLTERAVSRLRGGPPAWQLAIRRLQLDSGTPSRVVAGVVVVVAGVIALNVLLDTTGASDARTSEPRDSGTALVNIQGGNEAAALARLRALPAVRSADTEYHGVLRGDKRYDLLIAPCSVLERDYRMSGCVDGDAFVTGGATPGQTFSVSGSEYVDSEGNTKNVRPQGGTVTVPANAKVPEEVTRGGEQTVTLTPAAAASVDLSELQAWVNVKLSSDPGALNEVYAAMAPWQWQADVSTSEILGHAAGASYLTELKTLLSAGALLTLSLAGVSLLVMLIGQISERRRPLAAMSAGGVPRGVLERSLLWQNAIPMFFGVLVAVGGGIGIGALVVRMTDESSAKLDWGFIAALAAAAVALVLAVTAATLPSLRSVTRVETLRAE
jgi:hypothetical protein